MLSTLVSYKLFHTFKSNLFLKIDAGSESKTIFLYHSKKHQGEKSKATRLDILDFIVRRLRYSFEKFGQKMATSGTNLSW